MFFQDLGKATKIRVTGKFEQLQKAFLFTRSSVYGGWQEIERGLISFVEKDIKIIDLMIYSGHAKVICAALNADLFTQGHVWFTVEWAWSQITEQLADYCTEVSSSTEELSHFSSFILVSETIDPNMNGMKEKDTG